MLLLAGSTSFFGQSSFIHGTVYDAETGEPVGNAIVSSSCNDRTWVSDALGGFTINSTDQCDSLKINHPSYRTAELRYPKDGLVVLLQPDALTILSDAVVAAKAADADTRRTPASVVTLKSPILTADDQSSLSLALNSVPGVQFEQRGLGGSRRINIRSSMVRSPFAVRNFQLYLDQFSLTSPDGQVALELIDPFDLAQLTVVKGPAANSWGAGIGGALLAESKRAPGGGSAVLGSSITAGSFGFVRSTSALSVSGSQFNLRISHIHQETDGYRLQEFNKRRQLSMRLQYYASNTLDYTLWSTVYEGKWGLPGGLAADQAAEDPTSASPYAVDNFTHVHRRRFRTGITQRWTQRYFQNLTTVYVNTTTKINPFGTSPFFNGYKDEAAEGFGVRNQTNFNLVSRQKLDIDVRAYVQYLNEDNNLSEFDNVSGVGGAFRYENQTLSKELTAGFLTRFEISENLLVNAGITYTDRSMAGNNRSVILGEELLVDVNRNFDAWLPRIGLSYALTENHFIVAGASRAYSPPSLFELVEPLTGLLSPDLLAEVAVNYEAGAKGRIGSHLNYHLNAYLTNVSDAIRQNIDINGAEFFANQGDMTLRGIEGRLLYNRDLSENVQLSAYLNGALQRHEWLIEDEDLFVDSPYQLPGTPRATAATGADLRLKAGFFVNVHWQWSDTAPANSRNTDFISAFDVLNSKIGWDFNRILPEGWDANVFFGAQNILNEQYSSFVNFDAFGGRYFNPMPGRNYYGGIELRYQLR